MKFDDLKAALQSGHYTRRSMKSNRNGDGWLFLKSIDDQEFLFVVHLQPETGDGRESPTSLDWNDIVATDWQLYSSVGEMAVESQTSVGLLVN
jgi:hypothetical protein